MRNTDSKSEELDLKPQGVSRRSRGLMGEDLIPLQGLCAPAEQRLGMLHG